jgi:DNA-binding NtrC family response regulator
VEIQVPPLRHRRDDVAGLAQYFLSRHVPELTLSEGALDVLRLHDWPGNVRELERLIERAVALAESARIEVDDLPAHVRGQYADILAPSVSTGDSMRAWGSRYARLIYERCGRNKRLASRLLDISYHTLDAYLRWSDQPRPGGKRVPGWARVDDTSEELEAAPG